jgi:hypothetical protein
VTAGAPPARLGAATRVVRFPLEVRGDLFLRGVGDSSDVRRFTVPPREAAETRQPRSLSRRCLAGSELWPRIVDGINREGADAVPGLTTASVPQVRNTAH